MPITRQYTNQPSFHGPHRVDGSTPRSAKGILSGLFLLLAVCMALQPAAEARGKTRQAMTNVNTIMHNLKKLYGASHDYAGLNTEKAIRAGVFPKSMVNEPKGAVTNLWGGAVKVGHLNGVYGLAYTGVPKAACVRLVRAGHVPTSNVAINLQRLSASETRKGAEAKCSRQGSGAGGGNVIWWVDGRY